MVLADRRVALVYRVIATGFIGAAILFAFGVFDGAPSIDALKFYTTVSNVICFVWILLVLARTIADLRTRGARGWSSPSPRFAGVVMMAITVTMLIYLIILAPTPPVDGYERFTLSDTLLHVVTPSLVIVDWLVFHPKGRLRWIDPVLWAIVPWAYLVWAFAAGALGLVTWEAGNPFPYPFMDVSTLGLGGVAAWIGALSVALIGVGYVYVALDHGLARVGRGSAAPGADKRDAGETSGPDRSGPETSSTPLPEGAEV
ncbi:hypothetical protein ET445_01370 [Agromyces protaetiae]|uniref:Pr6Pr family membrane protein n=1 Tax=Agromyces protaetiae TaxID=2509455 RepID=A0A4P6FNY1_9MICO|nr:Pr6Pr family membrane protein [Agromyces protaetiae]QAY72188.1 hypothetical protein ET445_01370 [Agromyces protaetiae]